jgi:hypothetical protein
MNNFWASAEYEPKRSHKFVLYINAINYWIVKTSGRPSAEVTESEHFYLGKQFKFPGIQKWQDLNVTIVEPIQEDSDAKLREIMFRSGYKWVQNGFPKTPDDLTTISKAKAVEALGGEIQLDQLDADGNVVVSYVLKNAWIKNYNFSDLDYGNEELTNVELTFAYDYATIID